MRLMKWEDEAYLREDADGTPISLVCLDRYHRPRHVLMDFSGGVRRTFQDKEQIPFVKI